MNEFTPVAVPSEDKDDVRDRALMIVRHAFAADPPVRWLYPDDAAYAAHFPAFGRYVAGEIPAAPHQKLRTFVSGAANAGRARTGPRTELTFATASMMRQRSASRVTAIADRCCGTRKRVSSQMFTLERGTGFIISQSHFGGARHSLIRRHAALTLQSTGRAVSPSPHAGSGSRRRCTPQLGRSVPRPAHPPAAR